MTAAAYEKFVREYAAQLRANDRAPTSSPQWTERATMLRARILEAVGATSGEVCPMDPRILGELKRPGYVIERLVIQTRPNVWMTANLYRPDPAPSRGPAVLVVHGHWSLARLEPVVQSRCVGLVRLGFTVLSVDAIGSGERYRYPRPGSYHGALHGATLWPTELSLLGLQLHDNRRAVDYLCGRPEVDPGRIGITGESGGGNQSMYAGAFDDRLAAVVPVCSVGNYQSYLLVQCCICEVIPGALTFTEEGDVLGLIAPRSLLVISAAKDSVQFSPAEADKSLARAKTIYGLVGASDRIRHAIFDAGHDYNQAMREAMYGWMTRWLKNEGSGAAVAEPKLMLEDPAALRCYPDPDDRPRTWLYLPQIAQQAGQAQLAKQFPAEPAHAEDWESSAVYMRSQLAKVIGPSPTLPRADADPTGTRKLDSTTAIDVTLATEPGMNLPATWLQPANRVARPACCVVVSLDGIETTIAHPAVKALLKAGVDVVTAEHRAAGTYLKPRGSRVPDYRQAEHGVWIGRPLLGQWAFETRCLVHWLAQQPIDRSKLSLLGLGAGGLVAIVAAIDEPTRVAGLTLAGMPATYLSETTYGDVFRMGAVVPNLFRVGDVPHLLGMVAPRRCTVVAPVDAQGARLSDSAAREAFRFTSSVYRTLGLKNFLVEPEADWGQVARQLR